MRCLTHFSDDSTLFLIWTFWVLRVILKWLSSTDAAVLFCKTQNHVSVLCSGPSMTSWSVFPTADVPGAFDCYGDWSIWHYVQLICLHSSTSPLAIMISCSLSNCIYPVELTIKLHQVLFKCCLRIVQHRMLPCQSSTVPLCPMASLWYFSHHLKVTLMSSIWVIISN